MDLMIVWQLLCMIQTYSNHRTIYTLLHSTMRGWMRPAEHVVIAGSQQAELANDYSLLFKDEHLNPARILPLVLCIITNKKHARPPWVYSTSKILCHSFEFPPGSYHFSHRIGLFVLGSQGLWLESSQTLRPFLRVWTPERVLLYYCFGRPGHKEKGRLNLMTALKMVMWSHAFLTIAKSWWSYLGNKKHVAV